MKNGKGNSAFGNEWRRTSPHWAVPSFWCLLPNPSVTLWLRNLYLVPLTGTLKNHYLAGG